MSRAATIVLYMMVGAFAGAVVASLVVPPILTWYNEPGAINAGKVETICNIPEMVRYVSSRLLRGQLIGTGIGAILFLIVGVARTRPRTASGLPTTSGEPVLPRG